MMHLIKQDENYIKTRGSRLSVGMSDIRSLPKLIVGLSVWRMNFTAETDQREFANFSLFQKWKLEITQELWVQLCSNTALLKGTEKLFYTKFSI